MVEPEWPPVSGRWWRAATSYAPVAYREAHGVTGQAMPSALGDAVRTLGTGAGASESVWLAHTAAQLRVRAGQSVLFEDDPSDAVYLLVDGHLQFSMSRGNEGSAHVTHLAQGPCLFGDRDLLGGRPAQESVMALDAARVLRFPADDFLAAWGQDAHFAHWCIADMNHRFAQSLQVGRWSGLVLPLRLALYLRAHPAPNSAAWLSAVTGAQEKSVLRALASLRKDERLVEDPASGALVVNEARLEADIDLPPLRPLWTTALAWPSAA